MIFSQISNQLVIYTLIGLFLIGFIYQAFKAGGDAEKLKELERRYDAVVKRNEVADEVDRLPDDVITSELRKRGWLRTR